MKGNRNVLLAPNADTGTRLGLDCVVLQRRSLVNGWTILADPAYIVQIPVNCSCKSGLQLGKWRGRTSPLETVFRGCGQS